MQTTNNTPVTVPIEDLRKIFAGYLGAKVTYSYQPAIPSGEMVHTFPLTGRAIDELHTRGPLVWINLKPLGEISDYDKAAIEVLEDIQDPYSPAYINFGPRWEECYYHSSNTDYIRVLQVKSYQYLQSKGYALPYGPYSVEQLVEAGIYKIIKN